MDHLLSKENRFPRFWRGEDTQLRAFCRTSVGVLFLFKNERGCSSAGRAPALQAGGRPFDPGQLHNPDVRAHSSGG